MKPHPLRAPAADGALLADPPAGEIRRVLAENRRALTDWNYDFQGRSASWLRLEARRHAIADARSFLSQYGAAVPEETSGSSVEAADDLPLIVTGHQPELFHPGVWVKNFAAAAIARAVGGRALNLIVDNDLPKSASIRVPSDPARHVSRANRVEYDDGRRGEVPFEDLDVADEACFARFPDGVRKVLAGDGVADPVLDEFWPLAMSRRAEISNRGRRFALARHDEEARWGYVNHELPLGSLCEEESFLWFVSHILAQLPRFQEIHNEALAEYRAAYGIRSRHHPVPALSRQGDWREAPFWVWRASAPRRQPLLVRQTGRTMQLRIANEDEAFLELPLAPDREACCAVDRLRELPSRSIRLRTRALTTTMFSRYILGDLFIHGIGGAKYDELGDEIAGRFFGLEPPRFLTVSMTIWLGLPVDPVSTHDLRNLNRRIRDVRYNPDRILAETEPNPTEVRTLLEKRAEAIASPQSTHRERKARWKAIRVCNQAIQPFVNNELVELETRRRQIESGLDWNRLAQNREFSLVLHSRSRLRELFARVARDFS
jgi:hypothetical protein